MNIRRIFVALFFLAILDGSMAWKMKPRGAQTCPMTLPDCVPVYNPDGDQIGIAANGEWSIRQGYLGENNEFCNDDGTFYNSKYMKEETVVGLLDTMAVLALISIGMEFFNVLHWHKHPTFLAVLTMALGATFLIFNLWTVGAHNTQADSLVFGPHRDYKYSNMFRTVGFTLLLAGAGLYYAYLRDVHLTFLNLRNMNRQVHEGSHAESFPTLLGNPHKQNWQGVIIGLTIVFVSLTVALNGLYPEAMSPCLRHTIRNNLQYGQFIVLAIFAYALAIGYLWTFFREFVWNYNAVIVSPAKNEVRAEDLTYFGLLRSVQSQNNPHWFSTITLIVGLFVMVFLPSLLAAYFTVQLYVYDNKTETPGSYTKYPDSYDWRVLTLLPIVFSVTVLTFMHAALFMLTRIGVFGHDLVSAIHFRLHQLLEGDHLTGQEKAVHEGVLRRIWDQWANLGHKKGYDTASDAAHAAFVTHANSAHARHEINGVIQKVGQGRQQQR